MTERDLKTALRRDLGELLREVLSRRAPDLVATLLPRAEDGTLDPDDRHQLVAIIGAEFAESGIDADLEPLPRGLMLEELLDVINRPNIAP